MVGPLSSFSHHCKWGCRDLGIGITFSSDSDTLTLFLRCHFMGLICSWLTCFSVAVSKPIRDINRPKTCLAPVLISLNSPANPVVGTFLLAPVYVGDKFGGIWLSPTSCLGTCGFLYPCLWPSVSPYLLLPWTPWVLWTDRKAVPWTGMSDPGHEISDISWTVPVLVYGSRHPWSQLR